MNYLDFNSRETYLAAKEAWKAEYLECVRTIRAQKRALKDAHRAFSKDPTRIANVWDAITDRRNGRQEASRLLIVRSSMKELAEKQWRAAHP